MDRPILKLSNIVSSEKIDTLKKQIEHVERPDLLKEDKDTSKEAESAKTSLESICDIVKTMEKSVERLSDETMNKVTSVNQEDVRNTVETKNKIRDIKKVKSIYKQLHEKYPNVINSKEHKMLKVGIREDIAEDLNITRAEAGEFCRWYCGKIYRERMVENADRYNLKGEIVGKVIK